MVEYHKARKEVRESAGNEEEGRALRFAHCSGGTYCDVGDYNSSDETQDIIFTTDISLNPSWINDTFWSTRSATEDGYQVSLRGPGGTYGFAYNYSSDIEPTTLVILKEPGDDAL